LTGVVDGLRTWIALDNYCSQRAERIRGTGTTELRQRIVLLATADETVKLAQACLGNECELLSSSEVSLVVAASIEEASRLTNLDLCTIATNFINKELINGERHSTGSN
jgi:hypothetical protein